MLPAVRSGGAEGGGPRGKLAGAAALLVRDPRELYEVLVDRAHRTVDPLRGRPSGATTPLEQIAAELDGALPGDVSASLREDGLAEIDAEVRERIEQLGSAL